MLPQIQTRKKQVYGEERRKYKEGQKENEQIEIEER